jgi:hypothetical protein
MNTDKGWLQDALDCFVRNDQFGSPKGKGFDLIGVVQKMYPIFGQVKIVI